MTAAGRIEGQEEERRREEGNRRSYDQAEAPREIFTMA